MRRTLELYSPYEMTTRYRLCVHDQEVPRKDVSTRSSTNPVLHRVLEELESAKDRHGIEHNAVADAWNALGLIRVHMQRDITGALVCHEEAYAIYLRNEEKLETAFTLSDLAYCHEQLGQQNKALSLYQEALSMIVEEKISEFHPKVSSITQAIARIQRR